MADEFADLDDESTVPCQRCGAPIPLKSFQLPPKLCDNCRTPAEQPMPLETISD